MASGTLTFLLTDIEASTAAWLRSPHAMGDALTRHDNLIEGVVALHRGHIVRPRGEGDSRFAVFGKASDAVSAACDAQVALIHEQWALPEPLRVRMAVHTGEVELRLGDYYGPAVNHCARLRAAAHGGQVLVSAVTADLVREALAAEIELWDLGEHLLKDLERPERIWQVVHQELPAHFPPLTTNPTPRHNLPNELSSFVGRERAIAKVHDLLQSNRLLTLTGPGGIGKTRLATRVAHEEIPNYIGGVWLVRLDALDDAELVPAAIASVLEVREQPGRSLMDTLSDAVGARPLLLVLDNCEHLIEACAGCADRLLQTCEHLHLLATSREPLGVPGETAWRVPLLDLPIPGHSTAPDQLRRHEAVRLFVERAAEAQAGFALTENNAIAVAEVCRQLDGMPLAIELVAARVKAFTAEQLAQRLDARLTLRTRGRRAAAPRQQTLAAAIDWSYALLSESERMLFRRLGVFAGGWTLEATEAVWTGAVQEEAETFDRLSSLIDKSLVSTEEHDGTLRYRLLETIRRYAADRLEESGEADAVRQKHADYFVELAERAEPQLRGASQLAWFRLLDLEHDNLRAALGWLLEHNDPDLTLRLAVACWHFWYVRCHYREGRRWLDRALAQGGLRHAARAAVLNGAGILAVAQEDLQRASELHADALVLARELGDAHAIAMSLFGLGRVAGRKADYEHATRLLLEAVKYLSEQKDLWGTALCLGNLGQLARQQGDYPEAEALYSEALNLRRELGDTWGIAVSLGQLGVIAEHQGDIERAITLVDEALLLQRELGVTSEIAVSLSTLGRAALARGEYVRAAALFDETLELQRQLGKPSAVCVTLTGLGQVAVRQGDYRNAAALLKEALTRQKELSDKVGVAVTLEALAGLTARLGQATNTARLLGAADELRASIGTGRSLAQRGEYESNLKMAHQQLGDALLAQERTHGGRLGLEYVIAEALGVNPEPVDTIVSP
jgi:predicted ATPase/class 3 adenylate cyclase/uncharacterized protein HemY